MRLVFSSFFNTVRSAAVVSAEAKECVSLLAATSMTILTTAELREVTGGDDEQLPKGGWKAVSLSVA